MTLHLTPGVLAAAYEYLRATLPFKRWKLPHADEVEFHVTRHRDRQGDHALYTSGDGHMIRRGDHSIRMSASTTKTTGDLLLFLAHEMVHAYQDGVARSGSRRVAHNREFLRLSRLVCRAHGWPADEFVGAIT